MAYQDSRPASTSVINRSTTHSLAESDISDAMDTDEDEDLDFWGGESPSDRTLLARRQVEDLTMTDSEEETEDEDDDDSLMLDDMEDDDDEDDHDGDHICLFGHR